MTRDEHYAKIIWHDCIQRSAKFWSWGPDLNSIKVIELGTQFHVQGFKLTGLVQVQYDEGSDTFTVTAIPDDPHKQRTIIKDVYCDMLVDVIDELVEKVDNYEKRVCQEFGLTLKPRVA